MPTSSVGKKQKRPNDTPSRRAYNLAQRWITNKRNRLKRHLKRQPKDKVATTALKSLAEL